MIKRFMWVPMLALVFVVTSCGASGGTADGKQIAEAAFSKIIAQDFDTLVELMEVDGDRAALEEITAWRIEEEYDIWKDFKVHLSDKEGRLLDPKSKSGIESEDDWKAMSYGKGWAIERGFYKVYDNDDWEKRLTEMQWGYAGRSETLEVEGQGDAEYMWMNGYGDSISVKCKRIGGLWYLKSARLHMTKELPKKPGDKDKKDD